jgi:glycosyltransferase involved in cell wall biosynthesis
MNIVWFSWKDILHPQAGGAEVVSDEIRKRLVADGHQVTLITSRPPGAANEGYINGVRVLRAGGRYTVYLRAPGAFRRIVKQCDIVVDEMNTLAFFAALYAKSERKILLAYQLAREVWFYQIFFPISLIGYLVEPLMLRLLGLFYPLTLTESDSSQKDFRQFGLRGVTIFRIGMNLAPLGHLKPKQSTQILCHGSVRPMKRTLDTIKAFEVAKKTNPSLSMVISGDHSGKYGENIRRYVASSIYKSSIQLTGRVSEKERESLMQQSALILVASRKEGWGLIVTEAASQGTPAIVYDVDGLRDSVIDGKTGVLCPSGDWRAMGEAINHVLSDPATYDQMRHLAWETSKQYTFDTSYADFKTAAKIN